MVLKDIGTDFFLNGFEKKINLKYYLLDIKL
jgi:hypothetical protein